MSSFRSRMFMFMLRHGHLLRGQLKRRATVDANTSIPKLRIDAERGARLLGKLPKSMQVESVTANGVGAQRLSSSGADNDKVMLYFHGGGYVIGTAESHLPIVAKFVQGSGVQALVFDYRLAPEHPFPAALDDSVAAYSWLLEQGVSPAKIAFCGDSAGGGLCLAALLAVRDKGMPLPAAAVALSPWTDLTNSGESLKTNAGVDMLTWGKSWTVFSKYYAGDSDPSLPYVSPLHGDLSGLPPMLIFAGGDELLRDDSMRFAEKAKDAGVNVTLHVGEGMFHCYPACSPMFPEAKRAMDEICAFVKSHLGC